MFFTGLVAFVVVDVDFPKVSLLFCLQIVVFVSFFSPDICLSMGLLIFFVLDVPDVFIWVGSVGHLDLPLITS